MAVIDLIRRFNNPPRRVARISRAWQSCPMLALLAAAFLVPISTRAADVPTTGIVLPVLDVTLSAPVPGIVTSRKFQEGDAVKAGDVLMELDNNLERLEVERRKIVRDQKRADFDRTKNLFSATKGVSKEEVDLRESEYKVAVAEHDIAAEQLRRREVIAPNGGVITQIMLEVGEACAAYQALIHLVDTRQCYLLASIEAVQGAKLKRDQDVTVEIDLGDGKATAPGKVFFISPLVDPASGLQKLKILFDNKDGKIRPGLTGIILSQAKP
jgi:RND family efflux transporter MFP subunit